MKKIDKNPNNFRIKRKFSAYTHSAHKLSPFAMERIGRWMEMGSRKYEPNNWQKGMKYSRVVASICRHLMMYLQNDRQEDHLAALAVNVSFLMHYDIMIERGVLPQSLDDLPKYQPTTEGAEP